MRNIKSKAVIARNTLAIATVSSTIMASQVYAQDRFITIGTGGQTGVYYVVGQSVCRFVNRTAAEHGIKCTAPSSAGSVANLNAMRDGSMDMGVAQSDWQYHALNGTSKFADQPPYTELRSMFSLYNEAFTLMTRADANINSFDDLKGKRVNVGAPGSGQRGTIEVLMDAKGWSMDDFKLVSELKTTEQSQALCDNKIDAGVIAAGHPNGITNEADSSCEMKLANVSGPAVDDLINKYAYYSKAVIPGGLYKGTPDDVTTFGVGATFVTSTQVEPDVVYYTVKAVFDNLDRFKKLHPAFENLDPKKMITDSLSAPLHEGAIRYYKERGWM